MHDLAVALRRPCEHTMLYLLFDILRIFIMVEQKEYQRSLALQLLTLLSGSRTRSPYWTFWKMAQPALNEDLCERELSSLARAVSNDTSGGKLAFCDKQFKLGGIVRNILEKWEPERLTDNKSYRWSGSRTGTPTEDNDGQLVLQFFLLKIRQLSIPGQFLSYTDEPSTWVNSATAVRNSKHILRAPLLTNTAPALRELLIKVRAKLSLPWDIDYEGWSDDLVPPLVVPFVPVDVPDAKEVEIDLEDVLFPNEAPLTEAELVMDELIDDAKHALNQSTRPAQIPLLLRQQAIPLAQVDLKLPDASEQLLTTSALRKPGVKPKPKPKPKPKKAKQPRKRKKAGSTPPDPVLPDEKSLEPRSDSKNQLASTSSSSSTDRSLPPPKKRQKRSTSSNKSMADPASEEEDPSYEP